MFHHGGRRLCSCPENRADSRVEQLRSERVGVEPGLLQESIGFATRREVARFQLSSSQIRTTCVVRGVRPLVGFHISLLDVGAIKNIPRAGLFLLPSGDFSR